MAHPGTFTDPGKALVGGQRWCRPSKHLHGSSVGQVSGIRQVLDPDSSDRIDYLCKELHCIKKTGVSILLNRSSRELTSAASYSTYAKIEEYQVTSLERYINGDDKTDLLQPFWDMPIQSKEQVCIRTSSHGGTAI